MARRPRSAACVGSPDRDRGLICAQYVRLPAPAVEPYILRLTIDAGSAATKHGVLHTNFPLDDSDFERTRFHQRECVVRTDERG